MKKEHLKTCAICGYIDNHDNKNMLWRHIKTHDISLEEYYNSYVKEPTDNPGTCMMSSCNNKTRFKNLSVGYLACCCKDHADRYSWESDGRRAKQAEVGRSSMKIVNSHYWTDDKYLESRNKRSAALSKHMTKINHDNWSNPDYRLSRDYSHTVDSCHNNKRSYLIYYKIPNGECLYLQSTLELAFIQKHLNHGTINRSNYRITWFDNDGIIHKYHPDFDYIDDNGNHYIVEVKPNYRLSHEDVLRKEFSTIKYLHDNNLNIEYKYFTELDSNGYDLSDPNIIKYMTPDKTDWVINTSSSTIP